MKKVLLSLLAVILILGALGAAGFAGYQFGLRQGVLTRADGSLQIVPRDRALDPGRMPMPNFGFQRDRGFGHGGFGMMNRGMGFGFFGPLMFLARLAFWALVIWAIYMLATRSGWRITRTVSTTASQPVTTQTTVKEETTESDN